MWFVDHEELYPDGLSSVAPGILIEMPHCPTAPTKEYVYLREKRGKAFTLICPGDHSEEGEDEALYLTNTKKLEDIIREAQAEWEAEHPEEGSEAPAPESPTPTQDAKP